MRERFGSVATAVALWVLAGLVLCHLVLSVLITPEAANFLAKSAALIRRLDAPAWVQAVGSIGAILATAWAVRHASHLQERQRIRVAHEDYTRFLEAIFQLVSGAYQIARSVESIRIKAVGFRVPADQIRKLLDQLIALRASLDAVDIAKLDRYAFIETVLVARSCLPPLILALEQVMAWVDLEGGTSLEYVHPRAEEACVALLERSKLLHDTIKLRGGTHVDDVPPSR